MSYERTGWVEDEPARLTGRLEVRPAAELGPIIVCLDTSGAQGKRFWLVWAGAGPGAGPARLLLRQGGAMLRGHTPACVHMLDSATCQRSLCPPSMSKQCLSCCATWYPPPAGSMYGARETVAKAVALECMRGAHRQQRKCYLYAFRWVTDAAAARRCIARSRPDGMPQLAGSPAHFMHKFGGICGLKFSLLVWLVPAAAPATLLSWSWAPIPPPSPTSSSSSRPALAAAQVGGGL